MEARGIHGSPQGLGITWLLKGSDIEILVSVRASQHDDGTALFRSGLDYYISAALICQARTLNPARTVILAEPGTVKVVEFRRRLRDAAAVEHDLGNLGESTLLHGCSVRPTRLRWSRWIFSQTRNQDVCNQSLRQCWIMSEQQVSTTTYVRSNPRPPNRVTTKKRFASRARTCTWFSW